MELPPVTDEAGRRQKIFEDAYGLMVVKPKPDGESSGMRTGCLRSDSVKDQPRSMLSGKCVSFGDHKNGSNIRHNQDQRSWRQRQLIAWLHDSLGKDRVAMLASMGVLEEVENSVLPIITDDSYEDQNELLPVGSWVVLVVVEVV